MQSGGERNPISSVKLEAYTQMATDPSSTDGPFYMQIDCRKHREGLEKLTDRKRVGVRVMQTDVL